MVLGIAGAVSLVVPTSSPFIEKLVRDPQQEFADHYRAITLWGLLVLLAATTLAALWVVPPSWSVRHTKKWKSGWRGFIARVLRRRHGALVEPVSGWGRVFDPDPEREPTVPWLYVTLTDMTELHGPLATFSSDLTEGSDRDLALRQPIERRLPGQPWVQLRGAQYLLINASMISHFSVEHVTDSAGSTAS